MVPETETPEIHKTGSRLADKAVAFSADSFPHALLQLAGVSAECWIENSRTFRPKPAESCG